MEGWTKIKWAGIVTLTDEARGIFAWRWRPVQKRTSRGLQLVSPSGVVWDFKLQSGAWVRRAERDAERSAQRENNAVKKTVTTVVTG